MLESIIVDRTIPHYLRQSRTLSLLLALFSAAYIIICNIVFARVRFRINQVLLYPSLLLFVDSVWFLVRSNLIIKKIYYYLNNNIDNINPIQSAEYYYSIVSGILKVWHFSTFLK